MFLAHTHRAHSIGEERNSPPPQPTFYFLPTHTPDTDRHLCTRHVHPPLSGVTRLTAYGSQCPPWAPGCSPTLLSSEHHPAHTRPESMWQRPKHHRPTGRRSTCCPRRNLSSVHISRLEGSMHVARSCTVTSHVDVYRLASTQVALQLGSAS